MSSDEHLKKRDDGVEDAVRLAAEPTPRVEPSRWNVPNLLCAIRLAGTPIMISMAWFGWPAAFLGMLVGLLITDWLDGKLAVRWGQQTRFGARLDSFADAAMYGGLLFGTAWLKGPEIWQERTWLLAAVGSYAISSLVGWFKYGRVPSYHTRAAKSCWLLVTIATASLFADWSVIPLRIASLGVLLTNLEAVAITALLPTWKSDVPSVFHAWRIVQSSTESKNPLN
jgi:cardiolipin synthase